jgi:predicted permease
MANIVLLLYSFAIGIILRKAGRFPDGTATVLNQFIINVSLPAVALLYIHELHISADLIFPAAMAWIHFMVGAGFFYVVSKLLKYDEKTMACLMLSGGLGNTSFVGLPMINAFYGEKLIGIGVIADQAGTFFVLSTLGIMVVARYSSGKVSAGAIMKKVLMFPPFQAMILAFLLKGVTYADWFIDVLKALGATITPLALASVGFQLQLGDFREAWRRLSVGLIYKLILAPAVITVLYVFVFGARGPEIQVTVFEAAMAPMITSSLIAGESGLDKPLAALMVGIGIPLSFLTLPVWHYLLSWV